MSLSPLTAGPIAVPQLRQMLNIPDLEIYTDPREEPVEGYRWAGRRGFFGPDVYVPRYHWPVLLRWDQGRKRMRIDPVLKEDGRGTTIDNQATIESIAKAIT